jgi:carboxypeptidase family protein
MRHSTTFPASRILALVLVAAPAVALRSSAAQVPEPPPMQPAQPRDAAPAAKGTAAIVGRVTNLETGAPLRRALIRIASPTLPSDRRVSTNSDGRYEVRDLPAGEYSLKAERGGYLTLAYGQRRFGEVGKPLRLGEGHTVKAIDFALPRIGVISGRVVDDTGEPIAKVSVWAMQFGRHQGARKLIPFVVPEEGLWGGHAHTDENGEYSLVLPPGEFVVMGLSRETWPLEADAMQVFGYPPSFYPGVIEPTEAQRIRVGVGQEVGNIDFALVPARTARVSGVVLNAAGAPVTNESLSLSQEVMGPQGGSTFAPTTAQTGPDGRFSVNNVQAGEYLLAVRSSAANDQPAQEARQTIQVAGTDIDGLVIVTGGGGTIRGLVVSDDGTPVSGLDRLSVRARPLTWAARSSTLGGSGTGHVSADSTFELKAVVGPVVLSIRTLTGDWTLKAVEHNGRDLADDPIEVPHGQTISGVRVVLTNRPTLVRGGLLDDKQQPAEGTVVIFPEDTSRWREDSRTVRSARPDQHGEFSIKGLPAGKYLIAAVDYVQDGQWYDPEFLADLRPRAERLSLAEAESKRIDVTVKK